MYNFRTDLELERREIFKKNNNLEEIDGVEIENKEIDENLKVTKVNITNQNGEQSIGKPIGTYITIDIQKLRLAEEAEIQKSAEVLSDELKYNELDPAEEPYDFQWLLWQGFDHGEDKREFEAKEKICPQIRKHFNKYLSVTAVNKVGEMVTSISEKVNK